LDKNPIIWIFWLYPWPLPVRFRVAVIGMKYASLVTEAFRIRREKT